MKIAARNGLRVVALVAALSAVSTTALGQHRDRHEREWHGDIRVFHERDFPRWRRGHWVNGYHAGRRAWWWVVDGVWYAYPTPVYPYPDPYVPPAVVVGPPAVAQAPAAPPPGAVAPPAAAPQNQPGTWYYCDQARGYYPYVTECPAGWRPVPAVPPPG